MTSEFPDISLTVLYSASEAIKILGVSRTKFYADIRRGSRNGGIDGRRRRDNGRLQFTGRELLKHWKG